MVRDGLGRASLAISFNYWDMWIFTEGSTGWLSNELFSPFVENIFLLLNNLYSIQRFTEITELLERLVDREDLPYFSIHRAKMGFLIDYSTSILFMSTFSSLYFLKPDLHPFTFHHVHIITFPSM